MIQLTSVPSYKQKKWDFFASSYELTPRYESCSLALMLKITRSPATYQAVRRQAGARSAHLAPTMRPMRLVSLFISSSMVMAGRNPLMFWFAQLFCQVSCWSTTMTPKKLNPKNHAMKKRVISLEVKREITAKHERGVFVDLTKEFQRSTSTICTIVKQKDALKL